MNTEQILTAVIKETPNGIDRKAFTRNKEEDYYYLRIDPTHQLIVTRETYGSGWAMYAEEVSTSDDNHWDTMPAEHFPPLSDSTLSGCIRSLKYRVDQHLRDLKVAEIEANTTHQPVRQASSRNLRAVFPPAMLVGADLTETKFYKSQVLHPDENTITKRVEFSIEINGITASGHANYYYDCDTAKVRRDLRVQLQSPEFWTDACDVTAYNMYGGNTVSISHGSGGSNDGFSPVEVIKARIRIFEIAIQIAEHYSAVTGAEIK